MAVTGALIPHLSAVRIARPGRAARRFTIGFLFGVLLVIGGLIGFREAYADRILPNVVVGGVDVGSLTQVAARAALVERFAPLENGTVVIKSSRGSFAISYARLGRKFDFDAMVLAAFAVGRGGSRFDEAIFGLRELKAPAAVTPVVDFERGRLNEEVTAIAARVSVKPRDAMVTSNDAGFAIWPSVDGRRLDTDSLAARIETALLEPTTAAEITVTADLVGVAPLVSDAEAVRARDLAARMTADLTLKERRKSWIIPAAQIRTWITFADTDEGYLPTIDPAKVPSAFGKVSKDVAVKAREATYLKDRAGRVLGVSASGAGRALDVATTTRAVITAIENRARGASPAAQSAIAIAPVAPKLATSDAVKTAPLMVMAGSWTTYYQVAPHNGMSANITVPARRIDGIVVRPGQVFDYWAAIGEVSFRTGYRLGGAIIGGHTVEGKALGGGMCAVSTTLFNAAARSGLEILTRAPHWYYITRYPLGLDATVSGSQSMQFRNDTRNPILIKSSASPGVVHFEIWSVPNGRTVTWTSPSVSNVVRGSDSVQYTSTLPHGKKQRTEWPVDGKDVSVTRTVRDATGRVVHRDTFVSHYHRMIGILLIGS
jgi:vancomycin resistance protein YoaR